MQTPLVDMSRQIVDRTATAIVSGLRLNKANRFSVRVAERLSPIYTLTHDGKEYRLYCPNPITRYRAESFFSKEPETIEWIDTFAAGDVLFDIGANVGLYSVYAAKRGIDVIAFEPESQNYALANKNIYLNNVGDRIKCLGVALSDSNSVDYLYIPEFQSGGAMNTFGDAVDFNHNRFAPQFTQGGVSFSLDSFLEQFPSRFPNHIKIDVDGIELKIITGAYHTLRDSQLKSLLIEINEKTLDAQPIISCLELAGLTLLHKKHAPLFDQGSFKDLYNYVFIRPSAGQ